MDLRQLAALTAVADHHSFSAAARALHTVQSNVSTHVARLEQELGVPLVDRATGSLTAAGELVVGRYRRIERELEAISADVASAQGEVSGRVRLGVIGTAGRWLVPALLTRLRHDLPKVDVVIVDASTTSLLPQLSSGRLDLAVVNLPIRDPDVRADTLFTEDHVLVVPADHPLAASPRTTVAALAPYPLLLEPAGTGFRDDLDADAARVGEELTAAAEVDGMRLVASIAFQGAHPAVLPASAVPLPGEREGDGDHPRDESAWRRVEVDGFQPRRVGLATSTRTHLSVAAAAVQEMVVDVVREEVPGLPGVRLAAFGTITAKVAPAPG
jgi:LysR family hydrogen peroxide-inducible transcriptional activator